MAANLFAKSVDDWSPGRIVTITDIGDSLRWDYDRFKKSIQLLVYIFCKWFYEIIFWQLWWISIFMIKFDCWLSFFASHSIIGSAKTTKIVYNPLPLQKSELFFRDLLSQELDNKWQ